MNRAQRRALARAKPRVQPLPRLHKALMLSEHLPTPSRDRVVAQKIRLLQGIADLKAGTFGYAQLCDFHDFVSLALRFCDTFGDEALRGPAQECAQALIGIMERYNERQVYGATGEELRALQSWVEEIADYLGQVPEMTIKALLLEHVQYEAQMRERLRREAAKERA